MSQQHLLPRMRLREIACQSGWTAAVLETPFAPEDGPHSDYPAVVEWLLTNLAPFDRTLSREVMLQFDRCRPDVEIPLLRANARTWQPEIGLGVWPDQAPPTTWTKEEFLAAAPGTLRPVMYRVFRVQMEDPAAQESAWQTLLGSGVLLRVATTKAEAFLPATTTFLQPKIDDVSLESFPFYVPLLTEAALSHPHPVFAAELDSMLPYAGAYMRESQEDGGLLLLSRQQPEEFWNVLSRCQLPIDPERITRTVTDQRSHAPRLRL